MGFLTNKNNVIAYTVNKELTDNLYISVQNGEVVINAPWYTTRNQIQRAVEEKKQWILNKMKEYEEISKQNTKRVNVLGKKYELNISYKNIETADLSFNLNQIKVVLPNKYKYMDEKEIVNILMKKMYNQIAEREIERTMEKNRVLLNIAPEDYKIEDIDNAIAICKNKIITISPEIAKYSREAIDYIVLHEFCHLKYKNHTKSFYNMVKTYIPNYEEIAKEINGMAY
ncbi:MAG: DUF45 domain-containing protein [Clostridia bacterium]|nr:DUF45 domain-containing protein [Clostridia bacterium]